MLRRIRPSKALVSCLRAMALAHARTGELDVSRRLLEEALAVASALHGQREIALTLGSIAEVEFATGRVDSAIATATEALAALGDAHDRSAWVQHVSGSVASYLLARNEVERALPRALARLRAARIMGMPHEVVRNLERLGLIAAKENRWALAARLCAQRGLPFAAEGVAFVQLGFRIRAVAGGADLPPHSSAVDQRENRSAVARRGATAGRSCGGMAGKLTGEPRAGATSGAAVGSPKWARIVVTRRHVDLRFLANQEPL